jgi:hypothetical protein
MNLPVAIVARVISNKKAKGTLFETRLLLMSITAIKLCIADIF